MKPMGVIPCLITLGNAACGFSAIYEIAHGKFLAGAWLILLAMIFDAFDGKIARLTKQTSEFGAQLDSLADAVSFGLAPAILVALMNHPEPGIWMNHANPGIWSKATWIFCLVFVLCTILRLARYNVEEKRGVKGSDTFKGLPSPAAAGTIASFVILSGYIVDPREGLRLGLLSEDQATWIREWIVIYLLPAAALLLGYLMVSSRVRYAHLVNRYLSGKRPFEHVIGLIFFVGLAAVVREMALAAGFFLYVMSGVISGPAKLLVRGYRERQIAAEVVPIDSPKRPPDPS